MQNPELLFSILGLVAFAVVAVLLIVLWKKGLLTDDALNALGDLVDGVILPEDGPIGTLAYYARLAVRAVEQLVKSGQLDTTGDADAIRREKALELVEEYAAASGPALTDAEISTVRSLIEAEVYELRHPEAAVTSKVEQTKDSITMSVTKENPVEDLIQQSKRLGLDDCCCATMEESEAAKNAVYFVKDGNISVTKADLNANDAVKGGVTKADVQE